MKMDHSDWGTVLQYVADLPETGFSEKSYGELFEDSSSNTLQVPTPPLSHDGSPVLDYPPEGSTMVSISTAFHPGAHHQSLAPDVILLSSDNIFFSVHRHILLRASENGFHSLLSPSTPSNKDQNLVISVTDTSAVLNVILHSIYEMSCAHYSPSFETLAAAVNRLPFYGIHPKSCIVPSAPLFTLLLSHAPLYPLELYALAASFDLYELAVSTSSHLLSFPLSSITDDMARSIGPVYLKRLFFLHFGRSDALKRILLSPPHPHAPTQWCDFSEQKKLTRAWALASAYLAWDAKPDLSTSAIESSLRPLAEHLTCEGCQQALKERIKNLIVQWSIIKRTI